VETHFDGGGGQKLANFEKKKKNWQILRNEKKKKKNWPRPKERSPARREECD